MSCASRLISFRRSGWALFAAACFAAPASAATYYASPNGSATNSGTSQAAPWSLAKANSSLVAGDVCILLPGTYTVGIAPANSGTGSTSRIGFVGSIGSPGSTVVTSCNLVKNWISVKGVASQGDIAIEYPGRYDSIAYCQSNGGHFYGGKFSMIARSSITGTFAFLLDAGNPFTGTAESEYDTLRGCTITIPQVPATHGFKMRGLTQNCLVDSNRVTGTFTQTGANDGVGRIFYNIYSNTFRDNFWQFSATNAYNANNDPWNGFVIRDSSRFNTFIRDSLYLGLGSSVPVRGVLCSSGSFPGTVTSNTWQDCVFKSNSHIWIQNGLRNSTIRGCTFASSNDNALWAMTALEGSTIDHCTFFSPHQAVSFGDQFLATGNQITSNVFYSGSAGPVGNGGGVVGYASNGVTNFTQDYNLFFTPAFTSSPGDRSIVWCCYSGSKVGPGTTWASLNGQDTHSLHGSPQFVDSTFATLDLRLRPGSLAIGRGAAGTDAGALPFGGAVSDLTPPSTVADLDSSTVTENSATMSWTAPGDDGSIGLATAYDLRYSTSPITTANFASATPVNPQPTPLFAGAPQFYIVLGLTLNQDYYLAIKTRDDAGNWSSMSNVAHVRTHAVDVTPPAAIQDLSAGP